MASHASLWQLDIALASTPRDSDSEYGMVSINNQFAGPCKSPQRIRVPSQCPVLDASSFCQDEP